MPPVVPPPGPLATVPLPDEPSLEQLRRQAKDLRRAARGGEPEAAAEIAARYPGRDGPVTLAAAQLVLARRHGFASWARLKWHVEVVVAFSRFPERLAAGVPAGSADDFLRLACLSYTREDQPERRARARALLTARPDLTARSAHAAAAAADVPRLRAILRADPAAAARDGGPYRVVPLLYLAYARHDPAISADAVLGAARLLLDAGADPNAGYLWNGLLTPFTVLTGVFGEGELGPVRQPRHPHAAALARLLLDAGADPNDGQALYNRMFEPGNDHLELLLAHGLGTGDGGPWRRRLGDALDAPADLLRDQLSWAISHGLAERVRLLAGHGTDLSAPLPGGQTAAGLAAATGHGELVGYLVARGSAAPALAPADALAAAALAADGDAAAQLCRDHPGLAERVRAERPGLMVWAAADHRPGAVELLAELGFDVNARGRGDTPGNAPWETALHRAAERGDLELARTLLGLGADPDITDQRFGGTPLDWARYFGQPPLIELLEPLTASGEA
jgi:Ankyrin repeats (many copies)